MQSVSINPHILKTTELKALGVSHVLPIQKAERAYSCRGCQAKKSMGTTSMMVKFSFHFRGKLGACHPAGDHVRHWYCLTCTTSLLDTWEELGRSSRCWGYGPSGRISWTIKCGRTLLCKLHPRGRREGEKFWSQFWLPSPAEGKDGPDAYTNHRRYLEKEGIEKTGPKPTPSPPKNFAENQGVLMDLMCADVKPTFRTWPQKH